MNLNGKFIYLKIYGEIVNIIKKISSLTGGTASYSEL